jgi:putative acetyltransferase
VPGLPSIRPYQSGDCDSSIAIFLGAICEVASRDYNAAQIEAWAQVNDPGKWHARRLSRPTFVAVIEDLPAGFSDLEPDGHLDMMYVHPPVFRKARFFYFSLSAGGNTRTDAPQLPHA